MNVIISSIDFIYNWARSNSIWPMTFATSCCGIEMIQTSAANFDIARFGSEVFRASPRQADLLICAGTITHKMAPALLKLYQQMPEPKYVIAMGACTCGGGMFTDSYSVVNGIDKIIPVDIYLPMCPPKPEALLDSIIKLQKQIRKETILDRQKYIANHVSALKIDEAEEILVEDSGIIIQQWGLLGELSGELNYEY
jgi:NADH-quinone oxidoreductase subunit B